jgi:CheY-like chemotaxis protein
VRYEKNKIRVRLDLMDGSKLSEQLPARLATSELIELVNSEYDLLVRETQGELQVEGASTSPWRAVIRADSGEEAVAEVVRYVDRRAQWLSLFELTNPTSAFDVKVDVRTRDDSLRGSLGSAWVRDGETHTVRVTNNHTVRVYPVVLGLFAYDEARVLYPVGEPPTALRPGGSLDLELRSSIERGLVKANDVIKVIASTERIGVVTLNTVHSRGATNPNSFAQLFDYSAHGSLGETNVDPRTWATASVNIEVLRGFILWVDDNPDDNRYVRERFRSQGWETVTARSGTEALARLATEKFDLVISDFSRPEDDLAGYGLLDELKKRRGSPPLVYYVANYTTEQAEQARRRGALDETNNAQRLFDLAESVR